MNSKLRSLLIGVGVFVVGGVSFSVYRREPPGQPVANLRDAGLFSERDDRWVMACPEKITKATRNYLRNNGYGTFTVGSIHRIARVVIEHDLDDGGRELVNASLDVLDPDAGDFDGGDEEDETDDALQFRSDDCFRLECNDPEDSGIRELRLLAAHAPPYNRRSRFPHRWWWITLTDEAFPRLSVVRAPRHDSVAGPFRARADAVDTADMLARFGGLRTCTARLARSARHGPACPEREVSPCPGARDVSAAEYAPAARRMTAIITGDDRSPLTAAVAHVAELAAAGR